MNLFEKLRYLRNTLRFTLREVEKETGLSNAVICQIETGKVKNPGFFTIVKLANAYEVSIDDLLNTKNNKMLNHKQANCCEFLRGCQSISQRGCRTGCEEFPPEG